MRGHRAFLFYQWFLIPTHGVFLRGNILGLIPKRPARHYALCTVHSSDNQMPADPGRGRDGDEHDWVHFFEALHTDKDQHA